MIKIYHLPRFGRSIRVIWLMEELGEPYEVMQAPWPLDEEFKARTGVLAIPTIVDGDVVMGESIAILQYLTGRRIQKALELGLTVGPNPDPVAYAEHLNWLHFGEASLMVHAAMFSRIRRLAEEPEKSGYGATACETVLNTRLEALERHLADGRPHLTGEAFTIADISVGYALAYARLRELDGMFGPQTLAYLDRVTSRPGYQVAGAA
jgi:glutathione S-transferase/3-isopropylmalate dehydratase